MNNYGLEWSEQAAREAADDRYFDKIHSKSLVKSGFDDADVDTCHACRAGEYIFGQCDDVCCPDFRCDCSCHGCDGVDDGCVEYKNRKKSGNMGKLEKIAAEIFILADELEKTFPYK